MTAPWARAQSPIAPTVRSYFTVTPVPFEAARLDNKGGRTIAVASTVASVATPPEIVELARALKNDPDLIYQYVHDNIEFSPLWGVLKGPVGTLLDGRGNSFDQSALMVALLQQASLSNPAISNISFQFGELNLTSAQLQSWLGVDSNPNSVGGVLASGGIPATVFSNGAASVGQLWVKVSINGTPYIFDPAFKPHTWKTGIVASLPTIMGYSQANFISDAGATVTSNSIHNVNRNALRADLTSYSNNLATYIRQNLPNAGVADIVGGGTIVPTSLVNGVTVRQSTNPNQSSPPTEWASIPSSYYATLSVTLPGAAAQTFQSADIYGHRLSIFFNASFVPTLYLDGSPVVSGSAFSRGAQVGVGLSIDIPWATFANQSRTQFINAETNAGSGSGGYIVQTGWDQVGRGMVEKHRRLLRQAINSGAAANSELVLGESLAVLGYTWLAECAAHQRLSDRLLGTATEYFYGGGIVGEAVGSSISSPYVDLPLNFTNTPARVNGAGPETPSSTAAFLDGSGTSSSFESTVLEQTQANVAGFTAASTVKLLDIGLQSNDTIFDISDPTAYSTIRPLLAPNYDSFDLSSIDNYVASGFRVIAPQHGRITIGSWTGVGFKTMFQSGPSFSYGEIISGGLNGGFGGVNDAPGSLSSNTASGPYGTSSSSGDGTGNIGDPVDHQQGSYQYRHTDLTVGAKPFPYGLSLDRSYDSGAQGAPGPLGSGWTHNFAITAAAASDGFSGMGATSLLASVSSIAALYVSSDLVNGQAIQGQPNLQFFVLETVVNHWFTDQLTQNVVYVSQGWNTEQFTKLADGSYAPPLGSSTILDTLGGNFRYRTNYGVTIGFNSSGQIASWTTAAGAAVTFTYSAGALATVRNSATGRQLALTYSGGVITSVSDGTRTASYGYTNGNLISFTDPLNQKTTFTYDTSGTQDTAGHLTQIFYPSNPSNSFVTNFYDSLGRVSQQKDANGNLTQTFFAASRTEIDDPVGNRRVWYNDNHGNVTIAIEDYGAAPHLNVTTHNTYGAKGELLVTTMPEGNTTSYSYDSLLNPLTITKTPKPGSPLAPLVRTLTYIVPVAGLPNFEEVRTDTDPNGNLTTYSYDAATGLLTTIDQPAVLKPGIGSRAPRQNFTYTAIGLVQTSLDAEGRVTRYDYHPTFADEVVKKTVDFGRLNLATQYGYNAFGDLNSVTDPNGHTNTSTFDSLRRLTEVDGAIAGAVTKFTYHPDGEIATIERQISPGTLASTKYDYSLSGKIKTVTDALGNLTTITYDADDRKRTVTSQVNATQSRQRTLSYDALNRLSQISDTTPGGTAPALESYTFTANSNRQSFTDPNNHTTNYVYDGFDRMSQTTYPDGSTETYQYDGNGRILQKKARSGQTIAYTYDALSRLSTKTPTGEAAGQVVYGYDLAGRLLQASDASSVNPYVIGYDTAGRALSFTDQQGRRTQFQYDNAGNRTRLDWPANSNGSGAYFVTYSFDALNRMTEIDANGLPSTPLAKYQWDSASRLKLITYGDGTTDSYSQYDLSDNLTLLSTKFTGGSSAGFTYGWQKNRQRQSVVVDNAAFQYTPTTGVTNYGPADVHNAYTTVDGAGLTYDGNHNLSYDGFNTLKYDVENRLIEAQNAIWGTSQYLYDPLGHRKQKQVNGTTSQFVLAAGLEIADYAGPGVGAPQSLTVRGISGLPVATITPATGAVGYFHHDVLGSTVATTQAGTSGPADTYTYNDFGLPGAGNWADYRFAGYRYDKESGLYYTQTRYYSPSFGRFLQPDSLGIEGGTNLYTYVNNDPVNATDPSGKCPSCLIGGLLNVGIGYGISRLTGQDYTLGSAALDFGIGFATGGFAALSAAARGAEIVEGIYVVETVAGETYVGQSGDIAARLARHVLNGKITQEAADAARLFEVLGGKASREVAEQAMIDALGGIEELANIVNPIGGRPWLANNPALGNIIGNNLINWYNVIASDIGIDALTRLLQGQGNPPK